jgi:hypothetical protein
MKTRATVAFFLAAAATFVTSSAHAQDAAACRDGYDRSQVARDGGKLLDARRLLQQCSRASCSAFVQKECVGWLSDVEARIPSVSLSAKDGAGADLVDVSVAIDGEEGPRRLDGRTLDVDPGEHTFVFRLADGRTSQQHVLVRERDKGKVVAVTFGVPELPASRSDAPASAAEPPPREAKAVDHGVGLRTTGVVVGLAGLAAIGLASYLGVTASGLWSDSQNACGRAGCPDHRRAVEAHDHAQTSALLSTTFFVAGGALVAGGLAMFFLAPRAQPGPSTRGALRVAPIAGAGGAGLSLSRTF